MNGYDRVAVITGADSGIGKAIAFLASPGAPYVTGASLFVDGALGLMGPQAAGALESPAWREG
ncbi:MAG TPA: hypothetical protein VFV01_27750 [Spirillospora sp.]|nr:hypothetical protein [Spirillospora sp.]